MRDKIKQLQIFSRPWCYKAPDGSKIGLGPQKFNLEADTDGPGSNATATFMPGAANAVMHNQLAEQWFYIDGPEFYIWLCPEEKPVTEGQYYKIAPGAKLEIPPRTKFQVYNPSNEPVPVLMVTFPFWPQGDRSMSEILFPVGPFQPQDALNFQSKTIDEDYIERLYTEDPIAQISNSGFEYVQNALASIGEDVHSYRIAGETWFEFTGQLEYERMPRPEGCNVCNLLDEEGIATMHFDIEQSEQRLAQKKVDGNAQFENRMRCY